MNRQRLARSATRLLELLQRENPPRPVVALEIVHLVRLGFAEFPRDMAAMVGQWLTENALRESGHCLICEQALDERMRPRLGQSICGACKNEVDVDELKRELSDGVPLPEGD